MQRLVRSKGEATADTALDALRREAAACTRCPLYKNATQTVFGEGPADAAVMLVGEQPGDREDIEGRPFVGPAGKLLDKALDATGVERSRLYVTNAVKHFKNEPRGKKRIHKRPDASEIEACRWWLDRERAVVKPSLVVAMGLTALRGLGVKGATIASRRGRIEPLADGTSLLATVHPSALLRLRAVGGFDEEYRRFVTDLKLLADSLVRLRAGRRERPTRLA